MPGGCARSSWASSGPVTRPSEPAASSTRVEPENRLVARSLERDWEVRLGTLRQAEADLAAQQSPAAGGAHRGRGGLAIPRGC